MAMMECVGSLVVDDGDGENVVMLVSNHELVVNGGEMVKGDVLVLVDLHEMVVDYLAMELVVD